MPNGGSDNCGTCGFNSFNEGAWGFRELRDEDSVEVCVIRGIELTSSFGTCCVNWHSQDPIPEGPMFAFLYLAGRVPWFMGRVPAGTANGECVVCGKRFEYRDTPESEGVQIVGHDGGDLRFCGAKHYLKWWKTKHGGQKLPFYDYMPHSKTQNQIAAERRRENPRARRSWWRFWGA